MQLGVRVPQADKTEGGVGRGNTISGIFFGGVARPGSRSSMKFALDFLLLLHVKLSLHLLYRRLIMSAMQASQTMFA